MLLSELPVDIRAFREMAKAWPSSLLPQGDAVAWPIWTFFACNEVTNDGH